MSGEQLFSAKKPVMAHIKHILINTPNLESPRIQPTHSPTHHTHPSMLPFRDLKRKLSDILLTYHVTTCIPKLTHQLQQIMSLLLEPELCNPPQPASTRCSSNTITFLLAGRTTLSENSPSEIIVVHYTIAQRSPYLRSFLPSQIPPLLSLSSTPSSLAPITLPSIDPAAFKIYISYLRTSLVPTPNPHRSLTLHTCTDLLYAHMLGSVICAPHFQDCVIDALSQVLDTVQAPDLRVLELLYLEEGVSGLLRRFVVDSMFRWERRMLGVLRGRGIDGGGIVARGCEYHVHDGGACYKDLNESINEAVGQEHEEEMRMKRWSIEDDTELNAMAVHYLGGRHENSAEELQSFRGIVDRKSTRQDRFRPNGPRPIPRAVSIHSRTISTKITVSYTTASQYLSKPLPLLPCTLRLRRETPNIRDPVLDSFDQCSLTMSLRRNLPFTPLPPKPTHCPPPPYSPPPPSPFPMVRLSPEPFVLRPQPTLPSTPAPQTMILATPPPYRIATPSNFNFASLLKRKPAPARGQDWVDQWDTLFAIQGTQGFGLQKVFSEKQKLKSGRYS